MSQCKYCGETYHYCSSCGYDYELQPLSEGYCGWTCYELDRGESYAQFEVRMLLDDAGQAEHNDEGE